MQDEHFQGIHVVLVEEDEEGTTDEGEVSMIMMDAVPTITSLVCDEDDQDTVIVHYPAAYSLLVMQETQETTLM